ncbi:MAG: GvpL/GvpF family gas vesicle protein [Tepidisphaeraceae bacterium]
MMTSTAPAEKVYALLGITLETPVQARSGWSLVPADGLLAVLAEHDADQFVGEAAQRDLADPLKVTSLALAHAEQVEQLFHQTAVLPVALGSLFSTPAAVEQLLRRNRDAIVQFLRRVADHQEWAVKAAIDAKIGKEHFIERAIAAAQIDPQMSDGARYFRERAIRRQAASQFQAVLHQRCQQLRQPLSEACADVVERSILPRNDGRQSVASWSLLVSNRFQGELSARIAAMESSLADAEIALELSGPWPPWSFVPRLN